MTRISLTSDGAEQRKDRHREDDGRKRLDRVEHDHRAVVDRPAEVPAEQAEQHAADDGNQHGGDRGASSAMRAP
jgi:hypothetical protein